MNKTIAKWINVRSLLPGGTLWSRLVWYIKFLGRGEVHGVEVGHDHMGRCIFVEYRHLGPFTFLNRVYTHE